MEIPNVKVPHIGRKIEKLRELRGMKQETLAARLGITQQAVSKIEKSEKVDEEKLNKIADALGVSVDAIKNFNEDAAINLFQNYNTINDTGSASFTGIVNNYGNVKEEALSTLIELYKQLAEAEKERNKLFAAILEKLTAK